MKLLIALSAVLAVALAQAYGGTKDAKADYKDNSYGAYDYYGMFPGKCGNDGLYYTDSSSFVICSNGNSFVQSCPQGTRNSGYGKYSYGGRYDYRDFCDLNLVIHGYAKPAAVKPAYSGDKYDGGYKKDRRAYSFGTRYYDNGGG